MAEIAAIGLWKDSLVRSGPENMAVDSWLLERGEPVMRVYGWKGDWCSMGYFGSVHEARTVVPGVSLVRRATGGGLVDHRDDLTYTIVVPRTSRLAGPQGAAEEAPEGHGGRAAEGRREEGAAPRARGADRRHRRGAPAAQPRVEVGPRRGAARPLGAAVRLRDGHALQQRDARHGDARELLGRAAGRRGEGLVARSSKEPGGDVGRETGFRSSGRHGVAAAELLETRQERADAAAPSSERRERGHAPELRREGTPLLRSTPGGLLRVIGEVRARPGRREARAGPALQAAPVRDDAHAHVQRPPGPVSQRPRVYDDALADAPQDEKARGVEARRVRLLQAVADRGGRRRRAPGPPGPGVEGAPRRAGRGPRVRRLGHGDDRPRRQGDGRRRGRRREGLREADAGVERAARRTLSELQVPLPAEQRPQDPQVLPREARAERAVPALRRPRAARATRLGEALLPRRARRLPQARQSSAQRPPVEAID